MNCYLYYSDDVSNKLLFLVSRSQCKILQTFLVLPTVISFIFPVSHITVLVFLLQFSLSQMLTILIGAWALNKYVIYSVDKVILSSILGMQYMLSHGNRKRSLRKSSLKNLKQRNVINFCFDDIHEMFIV